MLLNRELPRYLFWISLIYFSFFGFVSCGEQIYTVSLEHDHSDAHIALDAYDRQSKYFGIHAPGGWTELPIRFEVDQTLDEEQIQGILAAMELWETALGKQIFEFEGLDSAIGNDFKDLYSSLDDDTNSFYSDLDWQKNNKSESVLATTIWDLDPKYRTYIQKADIHFNTEHYLIGDSLTLELSPTDHREIVDMQTLALHELGHFLGLTHISKQDDPNSIMNASIYIGQGLTNRCLSYGDIKRIQQIYGCEGEICDLREGQKLCGD